MAKKSLKKSREERLKLIKLIERKRKSKLISYITSDRFGLSTQIAEDSISIINDHLRNLKIKPNDNIDLFLYSRGGDTDVPWSLVSMMREYVPEGNFNVIIPYKAHSAATVIALGADNIIMTKKAELGPIDATTLGPHNPYDNIIKKKRPISVEDVNGYFNLIEKINIENKSQAFKSLTDSVEPLALGTVHRILEQTKLVATRMIETRKDKIPKGNIEEIVKMLSSEIYSHRHAISRTEAKDYLKLNYIQKTEELDIDNEVWELYKLYSDFFEFDTPFLPDQYIFENNLNEHTWKGLNLACIESELLLSLRRIDMKVRRIKNFSGNVNLAINNLSLPPINFTKGDENFDLKQIQTAIKQYFELVVKKIIDDASQKVLNEFISRLPEQGLEKKELNSKWVKIN